MSKRLISLSILVVALAFVFAFATHARAQYSSNNQIRVDRDLGQFSRDDVNRFGDDRASTSTIGDADRDADSRLHDFVPNTYGLMGNIGYDGGGGN